MRKPQRFAIKRLAEQDGQSRIFAVLAATCLFGFAALATDVGIMMSARRQAQTAAAAVAIGEVWNANTSAAPPRQP